LRTLRVAVESSAVLGSVAATAGAATLLFSLVARGDLPHLNSLTVVDGDVAQPWASERPSFLSPLARDGAEPLQHLRTLRLSCSGAAARAHMRCLTSLARRGGLRGLKELAIYGEREPTISDAEVAALLRAIAGPPALGGDDTKAEAPSVGALTAMDFTGTLAGAATMEAILEILERLPQRPTFGVRLAPYVSVNLEDTPAATSPEHQALYCKLQRVLPVRAA